MLDGIIGKRLGHADLADAKSGVVRHKFLETFNGGAICQPSGVKPCGTIVDQHLLSLKHEPGADLIGCLHGQRDLLDGHGV